MIHDIISERIYDNYTMNEGSLRKGGIRKKRRKMDKSRNNQNIVLIASYTTSSQSG